MQHEYKRAMFKPMKCDISVRGKTKIRIYARIKAIVSS